MIWRLWCDGCDLEDHVEDVTEGQCLEWVGFHQGHGLGGFFTPERTDAEPCMCGTEFTCMAAHNDGLEGGSDG